MSHARRREREPAEAAYRSALGELGLDTTTPAKLPPELTFNLGILLADAADPAARAEARALLRAYVDNLGADERRRLRARILLRELGD